MELPLRCHLRPAMLLVVIFLCIGKLNAQDPPVPPEKLSVEYRRDRGAPMSIRGYEHYTAFLVDSVSVKGKRGTGLARIHSPQHGSIAFPELRRGEIVPMIGYLYRVEFPALQLVRLKTEEVPKGIAVAKDSFVVPLMRDEQGSGQIMYMTAKDEFTWKTVFVTEILAAEKGGRHVARIKLDDIRKESQEFLVGDVLKFGQTEWIVRAVVPRDAVSGTLGWVELANKK